MTKKTIKKSTLALLCLLCAGVAQFIFQTSQLSKGTEYIVSSLTNDDTYYYLQTAWNAKHLGFVTFDGLHTTNGVQFAWFGIIFLLSIISSTKMALLYITLATCFLLNVLCYFVIWKIFQILNQPALSVFAASFWLAVSLTSTYSLGLENSLHAFIYWFLIWQVLIFLRQVQKKETPNIIALTLILVLNAWVRLDSAVFSAVIYLSCIIILGLSYPNIRLFLRENAKLLAISILLAGTGLVIQLGAFWLMGGSLLPVSAIVKSSGANWGWGANSLRYLTDLLLLSIPESLYIPLFVASFSWLVFLGLAIGLKRIKPGIDQTKNINFRQLWFIQFIGMLVYHLVIVLYGIFDSPYFTWYRSPSYIFWIITLVNLVFFIQDIHPKLKIEVFERILIALSLTTIFLSGYLFVQNSLENNKMASKDFHTHRYQIALWISENSPPDTIYAAWNAGELGFFSNQKVINLDGLINNVEYYESVLLSPTPMEALAVYLDENHVSYIVDYQENEHTSRLPIVKSFPSPDESDRLIRIWQVIPWSR